MGILAQILPDAAIASAGERLGAVGIVVAGCVFIVKYLIAERTKTNERLIVITDRFLSTAESFARLSADSLNESRLAREAQASTVQAINRLTEAVDHLQERRMGQR